jgi:hypothetical protein
VQKETVGLATGGDAMKARVREKPEVDRPTLASQGIDKNGRQRDSTVGTLDVRLPTKPFSIGREAVRK